MICIIIALRHSLIYFCILLQVKHTSWKVILKFKEQCQKGVMIQKKKSAQ